MKTRLAIRLALAVAGMALWAAPASAQRLLPPYEIATSIRSMGLEPLGQPVRQGARYILRARDASGAEVIVAADALTGRVRWVEPAGHGAAPYAGRPYDAYTPQRFAHEPPPIYGRRPIPPARVPTAGKPVASKAASTKAPKPAASPPKIETTDATPPEQPTETTGAIPSTPPPETSAFAVPPVQSFD